MSTIIDFDEKLKKRTIDFCNDELNWHLSNAEPDEYADETLAELELLFKLGDEWNAKKYAKIFIEDMKEQIKDIENNQPGLVKWIESMRSKVKEAENLIQEYDLKENEEKQSMDSEDSKQKWIVAVSGTETNGTDVEIVIGSKDQVKDYILKLIKDGIKEDEDRYDYGTESLSDLEEKDGYVYGYSVFSDYHMDYQANRMDTLDKIQL